MNKLLKQFARNVTRKAKIFHWEITDGWMGGAEDRSGEESEG